MPSTLVISRLWNQVGTKTSLQDAYFLCGIAVLLVGLAGFEPTTSCPPDKRANQAALQPAEPTLPSTAQTPPQKYNYTNICTNLHER